MSNSTLIFTNFSKFITKEMIEDVLKKYNYTYSKIKFNQLKHTCAITFDTHQKALNFRFNFHLTKFIGKKTVYISFLNNKKKNEPEREIFIGKIDKSITPKDFFVFFNKIKPIEDFKLAENENGESNGHGWIQFFSKDDALYILNNYNGFKLGNQKIEISLFDLNKKMNSDINKNINYAYNPNNIKEINHSSLNPISIRICNIPLQWSLKELIQYFKQFNITNIIFSELRVDKNKISKISFGSYYGKEDDFNYFKLIYEIPFYQIDIIDKNNQPKNVFNIKLKNYVEFLKKNNICSDKNYFKFACYILQNNLFGEPVENLKDIYLDFINNDNFCLKEDNKFLIINKLIPKEEMREKEMKNLKNLQESNYENEIYVSFLPPYYTDNHLKKLFLKFGKVLYSCLRKTKKNINDKTIICVYGYVFMSNNKETENAIKALNGKKIDKRFCSINVEKFKKKNNNKEKINNSNNELKGLFDDNNNKDNDLNNCNININNFDINKLNNDDNVNNDSNKLNLNDLNNNNNNNNNYYQINDLNHNINNYNYGINDLNNNNFLMNYLNNNINYNNSMMNDFNFNNYGMNYLLNQSQENNNNNININNNNNNNNINEEEEKDILEEEQIKIGINLPAAPLSN